MQITHRWIDRDLSRLELVVAWSIILVLIGLFAKYMLIVFARAEQSMVNRMIININASLKYQAVSFIIREDYKALARLGDINPMNTMQGDQIDELLKEGAITAKQVTPGYISSIKPANYIGELDAPDPDNMQKGVWYYDTRSHELIYIIRNGEFFDGDQRGAPRLRFKVEVEYIDNNGNGVFDPPGDIYKSVHIVNLGHYQWAL